LWQDFFSHKVTKALRRWGASASKGRRIVGVRRLFLTGSQIITNCGVDFALFL
jgi:hypothetical protein